MNQKYGSYYSEAYYLDGCGINYNDRDYWTKQFGEIARRIVELYRPKNFLDIGCAYGYLVEALRDLGVEAYGVDVSEYAISRVREDIRPYCYVCNAAEGLPEGLPDRFDCVSAIEIVEHLYEEDAQPFIHTLCSRSDQVIFSSTPDDFKEPSHFNVQQQEYWAKRFAQEGFLHDLNTDLSFLSPQAMAFKREEKSQLRLIENYEHFIRLQQKRLVSVREQANEAIKGKDDYIEGITEELKKREQVVQAQKEKIQAQKEEIQAQKDEIESMRQEYREKYRLRETALKREKEEIAGILAATRAREQQLQAAHDAIANSTFWRLTWPARRLVSGMRRIGRGKPSQEGQAIPAQAPAAFSELEKPKGIPASEYMMRLYRNMQPIAAAVSDEKVDRLNLVTDSIEASHLLGGVATALLLATEFAKRNNLVLRLITRDVPVNPCDYLNILQLNGIEPPENVEYYSDHDRDENGQKATKMFVTQGDIFFATSWWSAVAIEKTSLRKRFYYIVQEVEPFFYPYGDEHLLCDRVMNNPNIDFIVNSHYLWEYFEKEYPNIIRNGVYFEPAFSKKLYAKAKIHPKKKYRLFFYARPNNPRNLFGNGVLLLDMAIRQGILNTQEWEICCAGQDIPEIVFCDGSRPVHLGQMTWNEYRDFVAEVDLALSLMYTPHPSYPPFDVAVSGGVVVTNTCLNKTEFPLCKNVLLGDLDPEKFMETLRQGERLAKDSEQRRRNYEEMTIPRDWPQVLEKTLQKMGEWL